MVRCFRSCAVGVRVVCVASCQKIYPPTTTHTQRGGGGSGAAGGSGGPARPSTQSIPLEQIVQDVAAMGFTRGLVSSVGHLGVPDSHGAARCRTCAVLVGLRAVLQLVQKQQSGSPPSPTPANTAQVMSVISQLQNSGQQLDLNIILDRLTSGRF